MAPRDTARRRALTALVGAPLWALAGPGRAAAVFPALDRPALPVRAPERSVLLSVARAGERLVAVGERGVIVLSDDAGLHWRQVLPVPTAVSLTAVRFADARHGWAVGHGGVILHTDDGGERWVRQADGRVLAAAALQEAQRSGAADRLREAQRLVDDGPDKPLLDLHFFDARHGFVVGAYNLCFETHDGGASWASAMGRLDNPKGRHLYAVRADGEALYIVGEQGLMLRSLDAGRRFDGLRSAYAGSWFTLAVPAPGALISAGLRGTVHASTDRGTNWSALHSAASASIVSSVVRSDGSVLFVNQSGQLLAGRIGAPVQPLPAPPLPPLADVLPLPDGALLAVGLAGALRLPRAALGGGGNEQGTPR